MTSERALNDGKVGYIAQKVGIARGVRVARVWLLCPLAVTVAVDAVGALDRVYEGMGVGPRDGECEDSEAREHSDEK